MTSAPSPCRCVLGSSPPTSRFQKAQRGPLSTIVPRPRASRIASSSSRSSSDGAGASHSGRPHGHLKRYGSVSGEKYLATRSRLELRGRRRESQDLLGQVLEELFHFVEAPSLEERQLSGADPQTLELVLLALEDHAPCLEDLEPELEARLADFHVKDAPIFGDVGLRGVVELGRP